MLNFHAEANQAAGSEIVSHFQRHWGAIHRETRSSSRKLSEMQGNMHTVHHYVTQSHQIITNACEEMRELPDIVRSVEQMRNKVSKTKGVTRKWRKPYVQVCG